jgi:hypothetical protein
VVLWALSLELGAVGVTFGTRVVAPDVNGPGTGSVARQRIIVDKNHKTDRFGCVIASDTFFEMNHEEN